MSCTSHKDIYQRLLNIGNFTVGYSKITRAPRYPDKHRETDIEHSFHLALSATELAAEFYPELDLGLITQFSLVHDTPEYYAGDTWTFNITEDERKDKEKLEDLATKKLIASFPKYTASLLKRYKDQIEPEARFVRFVDKVAPAIITIVAYKQNTVAKDHNLSSLEQYTNRRSSHHLEICQKFPEFNKLHALFEIIWKEQGIHIFKK